MYYQALVTQPLIHEMLQEWGLEISNAQLNKIIVDGKEQFHQEKNEILQVGIEISPYIHVDDTGARHNGKNGYCTNIGNDLFAWFESTFNKSRINFLELLHNNPSERDIREYVKKRKISGSTRSETGRKCRDTFVSLKKTCRKLGISFWDFLQDRISGRNALPKLTEIMHQRAAET